jgi:hypothetical protein
MFLAIVYPAPRAYGRDALGVNVDAGLQNALQQSNHDVSNPLCRQ